MFFKVHFKPSGYCTSYFVGEYSVHLRRWDVAIVGGEEKCGVWVETSEIKSR
jgi:hypothetical protein